MARGLRRRPVTADHIVVVDRRSSGWVTSIDLLAVLPSRCVVSLSLPLSVFWRALLPRVVGPARLGSPRGTGRWCFTLLRRGWARIAWAACAKFPPRPTELVISVSGAGMPPPQFSRMRKKRSGPRRSFRMHSESYSRWRRSSVARSFVPSQAIEQKRRLTHSLLPPPFAGLASCQTSMS